MDAPEARRFSTSTAERVGFLKSHDNAAKQHQYGTIPDPAEIESILGGDEDIQGLGTSAGQEAKLLLKYSVPLMGTYLLQYSFSLVTIFVVGHSEFYMCEF
jgi:MATE family multidrug resistance protein